MIDKKKAIYNDDIKIQRLFAIIILFTVIFAIFSIIILYSQRKPKRFAQGCVSKKKQNHSTMGGSFNTNNYLLINGVEFQVSHKIFNIISVGDFVSFAYRKNLIHYLVKEENNE